MKRHLQNLTSVAAWLCLSAFAFCAESDTSAKADSSGSTAAHGNTGSRIIGSPSSGIHSFDTGYTISKVRTAKATSGPFIVASSYEGKVLAIRDNGEVAWKNPLSGFMNHDLWCADVTGDGNDEILAANADGSIYCLNAEGKLLWKFKVNSAPMYSVCAVHDAKRVPYVVCGGYDTNIYYLSGKGVLVKKIFTSKFSIDNPFTSGIMPPKHTSIANFLRPLRRADGTEFLVMSGTNNSMQSSGSIYLLEPLADTAISAVKSDSQKATGELRVCDLDGDGNEEFLVGNSSNINEAGVLRYDPSQPPAKAMQWTNIGSLRNKIGGGGYRVVQPVAIKEEGVTKILALFGPRILLLPEDMDLKKAEILTAGYSFNDMWLDSKKNHLILASSQSGGSCVHVIDLNNPDWKAQYAQISPPGKIQKMLANTAAYRAQVKTYSRPAGEREPLPVYLMTEDTKGAEKVAEDIKLNYSSPVFLSSVWSQHLEDVAWRASIESKGVRAARDKRQKYDLSQEQVLAKFAPGFAGDSPGVASWGGHGNDPLFYSLDTLKKIVDMANGKKLVFIYPELEHHDADFEWVLNNHLYPLAEYAKGRNTNIFVRTKNIFWQGIADKPLWSRMASGEFADVFIPSMEETSDKTMELSVAGRMGFWMSGATDTWGSRAVLDNPSFDRMRQFCDQQVPNYFLRHLIYHVANGAQYLDNATIDPAYQSFLWELIAKGVLFVPNRSELLSVSPVHLTMRNPDEAYINEGGNVKWLTFYNEAKEQANPMVFSRMNGSWPGAPVTDWDFSRYAAGVKERRVNFLPPYENGLVLITPESKPGLPRGDIKDKLHPLYENIMKEFITDGRNYYSADGKETYAAKSDYYKKIETEIENASTQLPLTVTGGVAWVTAQTSPTHLRLTLIDGGYLNPDDRTAKISFHAVKPVRMTEIVTGERYEVSDPSAVTVKVPLGLFRFIDIELDQPLPSLRH